MSSCTWKRGDTSSKETDLEWVEVLVKYTTCTPWSIYTITVTIVIWSWVKSLLSLSLSLLCLFSWKKNKERDYNNVAYVLLSRTMKPLHCVNTTELSWLKGLPNFRCSHSCSKIHLNKLQILAHWFHITGSTMLITSPAQARPNRGHRHVTSYDINPFPRFDLMAYCLVEVRSLIDESIPTHTTHYQQLSDSSLWSRHLLPSARPLER